MHSIPVKLACVCGDRGDGHGGMAVARDACVQDRGCMCACEPNAIGPTKAGSAVGPAVAGPTIAAPTLRIWARLREMQLQCLPVPICFQRKIALKVAQVKNFLLSAVRGRRLFPEVLNAVYCFFLLFD